MSNVKTGPNGVNREIVTALKKAHSHLGNVIKMVEEKEYCIDILQPNPFCDRLLHFERREYF